MDCWLVVICTTAGLTASATRRTAVEKSDPSCGWGAAAGAWLSTAGEEPVGAARTVGRMPLDTSGPGEKPQDWEPKSTTEVSATVAKRRARVSRIVSGPPSDNIVQAVVYC